MKKDPSALVVGAPQDKEETLLHAPPFVDERVLSDNVFQRQREEKGSVNGFISATLGGHPFFGKLFFLFPIGIELPFLFFPSPFFFFFFVLLWGLKYGTFYRD
jgi:hypothetical protein